jgi:hypothetical protein
MKMSGNRYEWMDYFVPNDGYKKFLEEYKKQFETVEKKEQEEEQEKES